MLQKTRFTPPASPQAMRQQDKKILVQAGLHAGIAPPELPRGFTPEARNWAPRTDGFITPRSGLSKPEAYDFNGNVLGAAETFDVLGNFGGFAASEQSVSYLHPDNGAWSDLSYLPGTVASAMTDVYSGLSTDYVQAATIYDAASEQMLTVFSNNTNALKFFYTNASTNTFSDFTWAHEIGDTKTAKDVTAVNDRLLLFNVESSSGTRYPTRVQYSARGSISFLIADGAGAEDLMDMRGTGQAAVRFRDYVVLFTESEVWRATPTLDDYAFRFDKVIDNVGCPWPRTIVRTPDGLIFLSQDREVYITDGASIKALGPIGGSGPSRIQRLLQDDMVTPTRSWAAYNHLRRRYELYYTGPEGEGGFPSRGLFYAMPDDTWWPQRFEHGLTSGIDLFDPSTVISWDDVAAGFDATITDWDSFNIASGIRRMNVFTSDSSTMVFRSDQTTDDGEIIDVRWRSGGIRGNGFAKSHLKEVWVDHETDEASTASVYVGSAHDSTSFGSPTQVSLTTDGEPEFVPVWTTARTPAFELRLNDGSRPRIASFMATIQEASRF